MASGQGSHWLIKSPTKFIIYVSPALLRYMSTLFLNIFMLLAVIKNFIFFGDLACDRRNTKHFEVLNLICYFSCHLERVLRFDWHCWKYGEHLIGAGLFDLNH